MREVAEPGWALRDLSCSSATGASAVGAILADRYAEIRLAAGDTVTCTYRNAVQPPPSGLVLGKLTLGGTGETAFAVRGSTVSYDFPIRTSTVERPVYETLPTVPPGSYAISETPAATAGGTWERRQVRCGGRILPPFSDPLNVIVPEGFGETCVFVNEFVPAGAIRVRKVAIGATGTVAFTIRPVDARPPRVYQQRAVVSRQNVPVTATGDSTTNIPIGLYDIQESSPTGSAGWTLESVSCNGVPVGSAQGRARIRLTAAEPEVTCIFTNRFSRSTTPGGGGPGGGGDEDGPGGETSTADPVTNLRVTKRVRPTVIASGQPVRYTVTVRNTSRVTARNVVAEELQPPSHQIVAIEAPRGVRCRGTRPLRCVIGTLAPRRSVTLRATVTTRLTGRVVNRVAVHTSTRETRLTDNAARAVLRVIPRRAQACAARIPRC